MTDSHAVTGKSLQAQIDSLGERMEKGFEEIKALLRGNEERLRSLETREASCQPLIQSRLDAAWRKIDEHEKEIETLTEIAQSLRATLRVVTGVLVVLGTGVGAWLVNQVLGLIK
ncbi:MAG: hypothetical protein HY835_11155 [Anaerolineae bacterium]|nr:hypothetical protein [Anaerolineae bacterium]